MRYALVVVVAMSYVLAPMEARRTIRLVPSEYATIQLCANAAVAGDTCLVEAGDYDEVVTTVNAGTAGNPITYKAVTDCVSENGATVTLPCAKVRRWSIVDDYIIIQGFEVTNQGMTSDSNRPVWFNGANNASFLNGYIHDTNSSNGCLVAGSGTNIVFSGNNITRCGVRMVVIGTVNASAGVNIQTGVNDKISISVQGGAPQTVTLTAGAARTTLQIANDVDAAITGATPCAVVSLCTEYFNIYSDTQGLTSQIELLAVANDAYTTLGMTVGDGVFYSAAPGVAGTGSISDWLVEQSVISYVSDCFNPGAGDRFLARDVTCGPSDQYTQTHVDLMQPGAYTRIMVENVLATDSQNIQNHVLLNSNSAADHLIIRGMRTCRHRGSVSWSGGANDGYFYSNTFYNNFLYFLGVDGSQLNAQNLATNIVARNNIWVNSRPTGQGVYQVAGTGAINRDYDLWLDVPDPVETNDVNADPLVTNVATCNFALTAASPAIDEGGPLTTVAAGDSGSGTTLVLTDAKAFQDGWGGTATTADAIAVGTVDNVAQIVSIDYTAGTVTLAAGITRNDGDPVWLYANSRGTRVLYGAAPDIGALERDASVAPRIIRLPRRKGH